MLKRLTFLICCTIVFNCLHAQDSTLLNMLEDSTNTTSGSVTSTFKATQIVNTPTIESPAKNDLQFMIMHRFGRINEGAYALFGLDNASIRFAFDYGLTDRLAIGVGRSSFEKVYDASVKYKLIKQRTEGSPVSVSTYGAIAYTTQRFPDKPFLTGRLRTMYSVQSPIARKFSRRLSLQLTPTWIHFNLVPTKQDRNDLFALGLGGRVKVSKRVSLNAEYNHLPTNQAVSYKAYNSLSGGVDIETGGHVFQLIFSNSQGMNTPYYVARTGGSWRNGDIYFGFNITRNFSL